MEKTSLALYHKEYESFQKLDYFICGVAGALFAYIAQTYTPHVLNSWFYFLTPAALLSLTICFGCGLRGMQLSNETAKLNRESHFAAEQSINYFNILTEHVKNPDLKTNDRYTDKELTVPEIKN
jgi:hypothetical protein